MKQKLLISSTITIALVCSAILFFYFAGQTTPSVESVFTEYSITAIPDSPSPSQSAPPTPSPKPTYTEISVDGVNYRLTSELDAAYQESLIERLQTAISRADEYSDAVYRRISFVTSPEDVSIDLSMPGLVSFYPILPGFDLFYAFNQKLPVWFCSGLNDYWFGDGTAELWNEDELSLWLQENTGGSMPEFGDAWFIPDYFAEACSDNARNAAYSMIAILDEDGGLDELIRLAIGDSEKFIEASTELVKSIKNSDFDETNGYYLYLFNRGFNVLTKQGKYIYNPQSSRWRWANIREYTPFMDLGIEFAKEFLRVEYDKRISVELRAVRYEKGSFLGFSSNGYITLYSVRSGKDAGGVYSLPHEAIHALSQLTHIGGPSSAKLSSFMLEGMAELGHIEFEARYKITKFYSYYRGKASTADSLSKERTSAVTLYQDHAQQTSLTKDLDKYTWRYADVGSFFCYIYENYGMDKTLAMYSSNGNASVMEEQFGKTFPELIADWREYLWEGDVEPDDWWVR